MDKNRFWTTDRLLPRISSDFVKASIPNNKGIPISDLKDEKVDERFGDKIFYFGSKVIRYYQLTEDVIHYTDEILENKNFMIPPPFSPCSLFSPSFKQLTKEQKEYFLYFCQSIREEKKVRTSFQYIQLYLARFLRTEKHHFTVSREIFWVWKSYRKEFPLIDKLFSDFTADLCLYLRIQPPFEQLSEIITSPDFFIRPFLCDLFIFDYLFKEDHKISHKEKEYILRTMSSQSFRNSKAYRHHNKFPYLVEEAVEKAFLNGVFNKKELNDTLLGIRIPSGVTTVRKLFSVLCPEEVPKIEIRLQHVPLMHDANIRERCDEIVRYLENRIRSILKIKNCLSRIHVSTQHKAFLEGILCEYEHFSPTIVEDSSAFPADSVKEPTFAMRELHIDIAAANRIENDSRSITSFLTESYSDDFAETVTLGEEITSHETKEDEIIKEIHIPKALKEENDFWEFASLLSEEEDSFVRTALHHGKSEARKYAMSLGAFFEAMIASCNEKAQDATGDGIFDTVGQIYEEYRDVLKEVFPPMKGETK